MSVEDIERVTGRLIMDRRDSRKRVALLREEISGYAKAYGDVAAVLEEITGDMTVIGTPGMKHVSPEDRLKVARELPAAEELFAKCDDLNTEMSRYRDLELKTKDLNF